MFFYRISGTFLQLRIINIQIMEMHYATTLFTVTSALRVISVAFAVTETLLPNVPFVSIWNAPSKVCETRYSVHLNLSYFDIVANEGDTFEGDEIVIFYKRKLGRYPWIRDDGVWENGGLPQLADLRRHLRQVVNDVTEYIPNSKFTGVAVIDWESWRPIFNRNKYNDKQRVYIRASETLVRAQHPDWSDDEIENETRREFESSARIFMDQTLATCRQLRPQGHWGFYGFPNCYNYGVGEVTCTNTTVLYNDRLWWLFNDSTVIMPSVYLRERFGSTDDRRLYVLGNLREAIRVRNKYGGGATVPILVYTRYMYSDTGLFYAKDDLRSSIEQSADAGLNGVALWDSSASFESRKKCQYVRHYLDHVLGPFVKNLTTFLHNCSQQKCNSHGRCVRNGWQSQQPSVISHIQLDHGAKYNSAKTVSKHEMATLADGLKSVILFIQRAVERVFEIAYLANDERHKAGDNLHIYLYDGYHCHCYASWRGDYCGHQM